MSLSQRTHQERLSYPLNNGTTTTRHWKQPTNWLLKASPRSHRMWVVLSSTEEGRDSIDE